MSNKRLNVSSNLGAEIEARGYWPARLYRRFEPRTCRADYSRALSFEAHDPMWMLARQWQYGRFQANDCGTAVAAKVSLKRFSLDKLRHSPDGEALGNLNDREPWEPRVESVPAELTPAVRVEAAVHLQKMIRRSFPEQAAALLEKLRKTFKLDMSPVPDEDGKGIGDLVDAVSANRHRFAAVYEGRMFDGVAICRNVKKFMSTVKGIIPDIKAEELFVRYYTWFLTRYPSADVTTPCWNDEKLGYEFSVSSGDRNYVAENYATGRVGWFTFDCQSVDVEGKPYRKSFSYIPTQATFPGAPARRLWEYENRRVHFGNLTNKDVSQLASAVMMEYISLYSNDWMIVPVHTKPGMVIDVEKVTVTDCFGCVQEIVHTPDEHDAKPKEVPFTDRWDLFGISRADAFKTGDFRTERGLLIPASLIRVDESEPIEEVQFMRDEMANMLWGVEEKINDGVGGTMDGKTLSVKVLSIIDSTGGPAVEADPAAEFTYLVQNRVPVNWIPFIPQRLSGVVGREIRFRRGRMPLYYKDGYRYVRPNTSTLAIKKENGKVVPRYVNEEEVLSYGTKVILTAQRTRWIGGRSYLWYGYAKRISAYQANSGLMFDELRKMEKK